MAHFLLAPAGRAGGASTKMLLLLTSMLLLSLATPAAAAKTDLEITEFLASNDAGLADEDGDFSDWIEIYNSGSDSVNLQGVTLTDDAAVTNMWTFPQRTLQGKEYIVVFASGKDRSGSDLHTNFKLGASGEYLGIYDGSSVLFEYAPEFPAQTEDRSYGLNSNGAFRYFNDPTPGSANGEGDVPVVDVPVPSVNRGFYYSSFSLTLSSPTDASSYEIRYTLDGSEPTENSGSLYSGALDISTTTTLRAAAFASGYIDSEVATYTYIFLTDVIDQPYDSPGFPTGIPQRAGQFDVPFDTEMDPEVVSDYSSEILDAMTAAKVPTMAITGDLDEWFGDDGFYLSYRDLKYKMSIEILDDNNPSANEQVYAEIEAHSWKYQKRSMRINFKSKYGAREWNTKLFQNYAAVNGETAADKFRTLILRAGNNKSWARNWHPLACTYTTDQFYRDSYIAMTGAGPRGVYVHLYINGVYWGLYNVAERPDEQFQSEYFGGDDDDWFFTNHGGAGSADSTRWDYLTEDLVEKNMDNAGNYAEMEEYLNLERFADYIILNFWVGQTDWPDNNWYFANRNDASPRGSTPGEFFPWDGELSLDQKFGQLLDQIARIRSRFVEDTDEPDPIFKFWHALIKTDRFKALFSNRVDFHLGPGGALNDAACIQRWDTINAAIESAVIGESARWGDSLKDIGFLHSDEDRWTNPRSVYEATRTRDGDWRPQAARVRRLMNGNSALFMELITDAGFYINNGVPSSPTPPVAPPVAAPVVAPAAPPQGAPTTGPAFSYAWSAYVSGNDDVVCSSQSSSVVSGFGCRGSYCDDVRLYCRTGGPALSEIDSYWTAPPNSEELDPVICNDNYFMTGVSCQGNYCDNLTLQCTLSEGRSSGSCSWTDWVSEEGSGEVTFAGAGSAIRGMECRGHYCDDKKFYICQPVV